MADAVINDPAALVPRVLARVVGRAREVELVVAALAAGRHVLIEGPPGTGKSTLLRAVAGELALGFEFVEGNAELTPARLVGHFDPARVLTSGYDAEVFEDGPLVTAMRDGSLLYVEEINRIPEETLNVLITVMSERELHVPRLGRVAASDGFRLVAAMNPFDAIGTARISAAIYDRVCRVAVGYQDADDEVAIVRAALATIDTTDTVDTVDTIDTIDAGWLQRVVEVVRRSREHPEVRVGSSVRGAIDTVAVAERLAPLRGLPVVDSTVGLDAALVALSGRLRVREGSALSADDIVRQLWSQVFTTTSPGDTAGGAAGKAEAPSGADAS